LIENGGLPHLLQLSIYPKHRPLNKKFVYDRMLLAFEWADDGARIEICKGSGGSFKIDEILALESKLKARDCSLIEKLRESRDCLVSCLEDAEEYLCVEE